MSKFVFHTPNEDEWKTIKMLTGAKHGCYLCCFQIRNEFGMTSCSKASKNCDTLLDGTVADSPRDYMLVASHWTEE